ncbi:MAG TPA: ATPase [Porphyromonadaceae bacterium]|nr:ATPase [Muribaculaceae bacterium Isolate-013 (NCI)]HAB41133.1 ATPase [Porphyromonadaceae bacterium]HAP29841.1 ATPase [Porphyromonadaceae bacterium]
MKRIILAPVAALLCAASAMAQDSEPKFTIKPTGRILMDGAVYLGGNDDIEGTGDKKFVDGVAIPDLRLGVKAGYGKWKAKVDVGFGYGKVGLKDTYIEYDFNESNLIRGGYFVPQFGLNSETSSSMKPSYEEPTSNEFFYANPRLLALMHIYDKGQFFAGTTVFAEAAAMTKNATEMGKQAWGAQTRLVWRPMHSDGDAFQIGCSFNYSSPTGGDHNEFTYSANFPSRVSKVTNVSATIDHAKGLFKMTPEVLFMRGNIALEAQYYYMNVARKDGFRNYTAQGAYGMFRALLLGSRYRYSHADCGMATPDPRSLEVVLGYNYTNASDASAGIYGGITNDANCTFNYYINKYMIARLRYSYTNVRDRRVGDLTAKRHVNLIEARLQIIF